MAARPLVAMVAKDLQLFFSDRRAVIMSFAAPIAIASFFGFIFSGRGGSSEPARIPIRVVDLDSSPISREVLAGVSSDRALEVARGSAEEARTAVQRGKTSVAVIIPNGFGAAAGRAFLGGGSKPELSLLYDPSHTAELAMVRGMLTQHVMQAVSREMFGGPGGRQFTKEALEQLDGRTGMKPEDERVLREMLQSVGRWYERVDSGKAPAARGQAPGLSMPYDVREEAVTARKDVAYNGYAHAFAGMGVQFLLFASIDLGIGILTERQRGLWKRLRSAPVSRLLLLGGKGASGTLISLMTLLVTFGFGMAVFGIRIQGSAVGFLAVSTACALMASTFGLLLSAVGKTPQATRGIAIFAVLILVMLGGAWVPTFIFPAWLQRVTVAIPTRWAVDGLDAMTWRGIGLSGAVAPTAVLLGFALVFGVLAVARFRWESE